MDSQNSLETVVLTVTVFTGKENRWKSVNRGSTWVVVQGNTKRGAPTVLSPQSQDTSLSWHWYVTRHMEWCQQGTFSQASVPRDFTGEPLHRHDWCFTAHVLVWPRITLDNIAGFSSVASPILRLSEFSQSPLCIIVLDYLVKIKTFFSAFIPKA